MESELGHYLHTSNKAQLASLLQELVARHPVLLTEVVELFGQSAATESDDEREESDSEIDSEATEDWDFSGDDDDLVELHSVARPSLPPLEIESKHQQINNYAERLLQGESQQSIGSNLLHLLREAEMRADQHDYQGALLLYALILDKRLVEKNGVLEHIFDKAIDESMPFLEALLSETSSSITFDGSIPLSPLLTPAMRHEWLQRLFTL